MLPFCKIVLRAPKPQPLILTKELKTIGDHIRRRRHDLRLTRKMAAEILGSSVDVIKNWESNETMPTVRLMPKVIEFLGYSPYDLADMSCAEEIKARRKMLGLTQAQIAAQLNVSPETIVDWEKGRTRPVRRRIDMVEAFLTSSVAMSQG